MHVEMQSRWDPHHPARLPWNPNVKEINVIKLLQVLFDIDWDTLSMLPVSRVP